MTRQGPEIAIARLNPEFVTRLAGAIHEARESGLPSAGIFSAYRPPVFGVGGFSDKFKSLHSYGLAVDMSGIGEPGSKETKLWHEIAARHDIFCPYGVDNRTEWNHCQATPIKIVFPDNPLRKTISAQGPIELEDMFMVGSLIIDNAPAATSVAAAADRTDDTDGSRPHAVRAVRLAASERHDRKHSHEGRKLAAVASARARRGEKTKKVILVAELRHADKSHSKMLAEEKPRETRKAARASEGHRNATRHRSHLA